MSDNRHPAPPALEALLQELIQEKPRYKSESFNIHYYTLKAFIKVTRPWVLPHRLENEVQIVKELKGLSVKVPQLLFPNTYTFTDEDEKLRTISLWELLPKIEDPLPSLTLKKAQTVVEELWTLPKVNSLTTFTLNDFLHAVRVRLSGKNDELSQTIIAAVEELPLAEAVPVTTPLGFIHGDMHPGNFFKSGGVLYLGDWESACWGPKEWDVAQLYRFTPDENRKEFLKSWSAINEELVIFFAYVRTLTSLSHLVASENRNALYYKCLNDLQW